MFLRMGTSSLVGVDREKIAPSQDDVTRSGRGTAGDFSAAGRPAAGHPPAASA
jgi:hypothetical protein